MGLLLFVPGMNGSTLKFLKIFEHKEDSNLEVKIKESASKTEAVLEEICAESFPRRLSITEMTKVSSFL